MARAVRAAPPPDGITLEGVRLQPLGPQPPGRNDPCHCGSGKKYKRCHLDADQRAQREAEEALAEALPLLQEKQARAAAYDRRLREEYGVSVNYVSPAHWQGQTVWALGSRLYLDGPPNETFHEFILRVLRGTFGEAWANEQAKLPEDERHFIFICNERLATWQQENLDPGMRTPEGHYQAEPNGWVQYLISLAWDIASLIHEGELPDSLVRRLRDAEQFQGARYEIAIGAIFARLGCSIRFFDESDELRGKKHVEFIATQALARPVLDSHLARR
jgi:SEC-C motif